MTPRDMLAVLRSIEDALLSGHADEALDFTQTAIQGLDESGEEEYDHPEPVEDNEDTELTRLGHGFDGDDIPF